MTADHSHESSHHHDHGHDEASQDDIADLLDLDAAVLADYWSSAIGFVHTAAGGAADRALDLGAGTGTGALRLAEQFPSADVIAIDINADSLQRLAGKAREAGLSSRVSTRAVDLDNGWPDLGTLDLTWASMSLHHMADPSQILRDVLAATSPGGLIAVAEFADPLRFLPDDLGTGTPGLEQRVGAILNATHRELMPALGSVWGPRLTDTGWTVIDERDFVIDLDPPQHPDAGRYARAWFVRLSAGLTDDLDELDRATLAALLEVDGPHSVLRRTDLHIRGVRTVTIARRD